MREEQLLSYLKRACPGRKCRAGGAELERAIAGLEASLEKFGEADGAGGGPPE